MRLSIIIPIYNEGSHLIRVIERVQKAPLPAQIEHCEWVLVDDGSTDDTENVLREWEQYEHMVICRLSTHSGKSAAIRAGLERANGDVVLLQDADLEYDPQDYPTLLAPLLSDKVDVVYGSRFLLSRGRPSGMAVRHWWANRLLRALANRLFGASLTDEATAYKVFRADLLRGLSLRSNRFGFCPEVTAKVLKRKIHIVEVPIRYTPRSIREGRKIRWVDGIEAVWLLIKFRFVE